MDIKILSLIDGAKKAEGLTVIIDVFRAMTVEAYLVKNNASKIIPVKDVDFAFEYKKTHQNTPHIFACLIEWGDEMIFKSFPVLRFCNFKTLYL